MTSRRADHGDENLGLRRRVSGGQLCRRSGGPPHFPSTWLCCYGPPDGGHGDIGFRHNIPSGDAGSARWKDLPTTTAQRRPSTLSPDMAVLLGPRHGADIDLGFRWCSPVRLPSPQLWCSIISPPASTPVLCQTRVTISEILEVWWFKKGYKHLEFQYKYYPPLLQKEKKQSL